MADTKITGLAAIGANPIIPSTFPLPMVDLTDTSMAASGTTKKVTVNQILGAGGIATLASATITGDLTVDTSTLKVDSANNRVGIGTASPVTRFHIQDTTLTGTSQLREQLIKASSDASNNSFNSLVGLTFNTSVLSYTAGSLERTSGVYGINLDNSAFGRRMGLVFYTSEQDAAATEKYRIDNSGAATWSNVGGVAGTAMTLNSTGLGVGVTPGSGLGNIQAGGSANASLYVQQGTDTVRIGMRATGRTGILLDSSDATYTNRAWYLDNAGSTGSLVIGRQGLDVVTFSNTGNVGVGVTPSAWASSFKALQFGIGGCIYARTGDQTQAGFGSNVYFDTTDNRFEYVGTGQSALYRQDLGVHAWFTAASGTAGTAITFTQAMTLDASGNLLVGTTGLPGSNGRISASSSSSVAPIRAYTSAGDIYPSIIADKSSTTNTTAQVFIAFTVNDQATGSGQINANGASQAAFGTFSDSRLKENIVSLPSQLANILSLRPVEFDYKDGSGHQIGFVAQEIQEVYSDAVGEQNGFLTVTGWSKTEARLVSAIKELAAKVQALEAKLA